MCLPTAKLDCSDSKVPAKLESMDMIGILSQHRPRPAARHAQAGQQRAHRRSGRDYS